MEENALATESPGHGCPGKTCTHGFNFCFWAKLIVAIPAIPILSLSAAMLFDTLLMQLIAGGSVAFLVVVFAIWVDNLPQLSGMVRKRS